MYPGPSYLGSEDFAFMLQKKEGTYCLLGNGEWCTIRNTSSMTTFCRSGPRIGWR